MSKYLFFSAFFILMFCSCKKHNPEEQSQDVDSPSVVLLKKFIILDPAAIAPSDTVEVDEYNYDNLNRCTGIILKIYPQPVETGIIQNFYNGNDTLMTARILSSPGNSDSSKETFTYFPDGRMSSDSLTSIENSSTYWLVYHYEVSNNTVRSLITSNSQPLDSLSYLLTLSNGNIIAEKDSSYFFNAPPPVYTFRDVTDYQFTYDDHPCPFYKLYPKRLIALDPENYTEDIVPFSTSIFQANNTLSETRNTLPSTNGLDPVDNSYVYTYNANGYPATITYTDNLTGSQYKGLYVY